MIKNVFHSLSENVVYISVDLATENLHQRLLGKGYDKSKKTLFIMEGLLYYLSPGVVDEILSFVVRSSAKGSNILFDYFPLSLIEGTSQAGMFLKNNLEKSGTPFQFGLDEGMVEAFLTQRGFSQIHNVTSQDYKKAYFQGASDERVVSNLLNIAYAAVK